MIRHPQQAVRVDGRCTSPGSSVDVEQGCRLYFNNGGAGFEVRMECTIRVAWATSHNFQNVCARCSRSIPTVAIYAPGKTIRRACPLKRNIVSHPRQYSDAVDDDFCQGSRRSLHSLFKGHEQIQATSTSIDTITFNFSGLCDMCGKKSERRAPH